MLYMAFIAFLQNASFTLLSRARNSRSLWYHGISSLLCGLMYLVVFKHVSENINNSSVGMGYLLGSVSGSVTMHYIVLRYIE